MDGAPPLRIGILGGGQLGRMLGLAGIPLGLRFRFLDPGGDGAPAGAVGSVVEGDYADPAALERFSRGLDLVTWEFENVPVASARALARKVPVFPPPEALEAAQDRWVEKETFRRLGIPVALSRPVDTRADLEAAVDEVGLPAILKTRRFGYDGKGQALLRTRADLDTAWNDMGGSPLILEGFVRFQRELSLLVARSRSGETRSWPLTENVHRNGILRTSLVPSGAPRVHELQAEAERYGASLLDHLGYVGVLAIEFFETDEGLVANEMAPRVHNSGHWTQDGAFTSQFENHLRAILGLPLGPTGLRGGAGGGAAMVNFIGGLPSREQVLGTTLPSAGDDEVADVRSGRAGPGDAAVVVALHLYDKAPRPGRKVGHVNVWGGRRASVEAALGDGARLANDVGEG
jgi:5-(carboxyamino)imidazole ribonucleotide synthase